MFARPGPCEHVTVFYWVVKAVLWPFLRIIFRPWAEGTDNVPREGPAILASNHLSFSDHFFAPLPLPRKVVFLAKSEYFTGRGLKGLLKKTFFRGMGQIPVDRAGGEASERALRTGLRVLAAGELLGIYPEGTRTPDGRLYRGKTGVARLALESRSPVIPTAMIGGFEFQPPGKIAPRLRIRPGVRFGAPLDFARYYGMEHDHVVLRAIADEIMYELMKLSGQEYVDEYAQRGKGQAARRDKHPSPAAGSAAPGSAAPGSAAPGSAAPGSAAAGSLAAESVPAAPHAAGTAAHQGANGTAPAPSAANGTGPASPACAGRAAADADDAKRPGPPGPPRRKP
jgi:1-acyl-sn-glycerol-3-phosphate acyltransferase